MCSRPRVLGASNGIGRATQIPRMIRSARTTPPIIQPTGVEVVVDWAMIVVDLWAVTVVGVTSVVGISVVVVGTSVVGVVVVVGGSVVGVVVGGSVVEVVVVEDSSAFSDGTVVAGVRTDPEPGVEPAGAVVGVETDGAVTVGLVALPPPVPLPHAAKRPARATIAVPAKTRSPRPASTWPFL